MRYGDAILTRMPRGRHGELGAALELVAPPLLEGSSVARAAVIAF